MRTFHLALTGDFLDEHGESAYGDLGLPLLETAGWIRHHFLAEHAPRPDDTGYWERLYSMEVTPAQLRGLDGLVVLRPYLRRSAFSEGAGDLVAVGRSGAGYDKIDVPACTENDVLLFNAPFALNHPTASSALMFMLALAKRLSLQDRMTREGRWDLQPQIMGDEIQKRTLGIIGLGHSGRELVRLAAPFEMNVIAYSPRADPAEAARIGVRLTTLEEVMRTSDFVSLHARLSDETRGMIRAEHLELMKPTAYFINIARGEIVDQTALTRALAERRIAGAALDVFDREPLPPDDPLTRLDNVILSPHWSCSTSDVWRATAAAMAQGMLAISRGRLPEHIVNPEVLERPGFRSKLARFEENAA